MGTLSQDGQRFRLDPEKKKALLKPPPKPNRTGSVWKSGHLALNCKIEMYYQLRRSNKPLEKSIDKGESPVWHLQSLVYGVLSKSVPAHSRGWEDRYQCTRPHTPDGWIGTVPTGPFSVGDEHLDDRLVRHRPDRVARETLVDHHADDAHHRSAPVVALGVELVELHFRISVAHPRNAVADDISRLQVGILREERVVEDGNKANNLCPARLRQRRPRSECARRLM